MRRFTTWLLVACFVLMGTGSLQALHRWQHMIDDAALQGRGPAGQDGRLPHHGLPDESNCLVCVQLHQPLHHVTIAPLVVIAAPAIDLSSPAPAGRTFAPALLRVDCRGPPTDALDHVVS